MCSFGYLCQNGIIAEKKADYFTEHKNCLTHFFCFSFSINQSFKRFFSDSAVRTNDRQIGRSTKIKWGTKQISNWFLRSIFRRINHSDGMVCGWIIKLFIVRACARDCWSESFAVRLKLELAFRGNFFFAKTHQLVMAKTVRPRCSKLQDHVRAFHDELYQCYWKLFITGPENRSEINCQMLRSWVAQTKYSIWGVSVEKRANSVTYSQKVNKPLIP